mmetsp:Transcript_173979/g.423203  ORF Transcript_173979/g.423203 Transcript_173979/m.423203 type:complete len:271 (+) Transcript_173979:589-1401(+)
MLLPRAPDDLDLLLDVLVGGRLVGADLYVHCVAQVVGREVAHLARPGGAEHHGLPVRRNGLDERADLGLKAHVQHAVGLVQHEVRAAVEVKLPALKVVVEPSGRAHDEVPALTHLTELRSTGCTAVHTDRLDADPAAEALGLRLDLAGELAGGRHHQHGGPTLGPGVEELREGGQEEGQRLAAARLGDADEVTTLGRDGPAVGLDRRGRCKAQVEDARHDRLGELAAVEAGEGLRDLALAPHLRLSQVGLVAANFFPRELRRSVAPTAVP